MHTYSCITLHIIIRYEVQYEPLGEADLKVSRAAFVVSSGGPCGGTGQNLFKYNYV